MKKNNMRIIASILLIVAGVIALYFAVTALTFDHGSSVSSQAYGGDAYTGIQNAAAATANNVKYLIQMVSKALGGVLLSMSVAFIGFGFKCLANPPAPAPVLLAEPEKAAPVNTLPEL